MGSRTVAAAGRPRLAVGRPRLPLVEGAYADNLHPGVQEGTG